MLDIARYAAIIAIAGIAVSGEPTTVLQNGVMQKELLAAALIALLTLPNVRRWGK